MIKPENKVLFERAGYELNQYWLTQDGLHNLDYDMFFSPFQKYTCQAGCKICYISKELDASATIIRQYAPRRITPEQEAVWNFWFDQFSEVGYSDDLVFVKKEFPEIYNEEILTQMMKDAVIQETQWANFILGNKIP